MTTFPVEYYVKNRIHVQFMNSKIFREFLTQYLGDRISKKIFIIRQENCTAEFSKNKSCLVYGVRVYEIWGKMQETRNEMTSLLDTLFSMVRFEEFDESKG